MNKLILVASRDRKKAHAHLENANIDSVIVAGGLELDLDDVEAACAVLDGESINHFVEEFEL
jgi:hypothetical protein